MAELLEGGLAQFPLEQWFYEMPVCTRAWTTATVLTSLLVQCKVLTPFQLFYSLRAVFVKNQVRYTGGSDHWRRDVDMMSSTGAS